MSSFFQQGFFEVLITANAGISGYNTRYRSAFYFHNVLIFKQGEAAISHTLWAYCLSPSGYCLRPSSCCLVLYLDAYCLLSHFLQPTSSLPISPFLPSAAYCLLLYMLSAACCLHAACYLLPATYCLLHAAFYMLHACCLPPAACCLLPTAYFSTAGHKWHSSLHT
jgi:hypothetical protein